MNQKISLMLAGFASLAACSMPSVNLGNVSDVVGIQIPGDPTSKNLVQGEKYEVTAFAVDAKGKSVPAAINSLSFVSSNSSVVSVAGQYFEGTVSALKVGTATLIAKVGNIQSKPIELTVINPDFNAAPALPSAITAVGKVLFDDSGTTFDIPETGGTLTSADGVLTVVIPAGAVATGAVSGLEISMLENKMPFGYGFAYRIAACCGGTLPVFLKPIELQFLAESDGQELNPDNLQIARQTANGVWLTTNPSKVEAVIAPFSTRAQPSYKKLSVTIDKLGDIALSHGVTLLPSRATVKVGQNLKFQVVKQTSSGTDFQSAKFESYPASNWQVNGVTGGNQNVGQITPSATNNAFATYKAPNTKPNPNIVAITTTVNEAGRISNLFRNITIEDSFAWMNVKMSGQVHRATKTTETSETLDGVVNANYFANGTNTEYYRPTLNYPGSGVAQLTSKGADNDNYFAKVSYHLKYQSECVCTPKTGTITKQIDAVFTANKAILANEAKASLVWGVQTDGSYEAAAFPNGLLLEGDYTYHYHEVYPCGDRAQRPAIDKQSKATMIAGLESGTDLKTVGQASPINPGFVEGFIKATARFGSPVPTQADVPMILGGADFYGSVKTSFWAEVAGETKSRTSSFDAQVVPPVPFNLPTPTVFPTSPMPETESKVKPRC